MVKTSSVADRAGLIQRCGLTARGQKLAAIAVEEMGKPMEQALDEVDFCVDIYGYYAERARSSWRTSRWTCWRAGHALIRPTSWGRSSGSCPGIPLLQVARFAGPDVIVGNTILLKPAPQCPDSPKAMQKMYGEPASPRAPTGRPRVEQPDRRDHR